MQILGLTLHIPGVVCWELDTFLRMEWDGELAMGNRYSLVSDLINKESNTWKQDVLFSLFGEEQMNNILSILLVSSRPPDELVWRGDNTEEYTAKSGYKWLITEGSTRYNNDIHKNFYTKLWMLQIPSKLRILTWRINLKTHNLVSNSLYIVCQDEKESVLRGLRVISPTCMREIGWKHWLATNFESQSTEACKLRSITFWAVWYNRNKLYHEGIREQATTCSISGFIARNDECLIMAAGTYPWENISDPEICVEGDALTIIRKLNSVEEDRSCISNLIKEIKRRSQTFRKLSFKHVPKGANKAAHAMAKEGRRQEGPRFWIEEASRLLYLFFTSIETKNVVSPALLDSLVLKHCAMDIPLEEPKVQWQAPTGSMGLPVVGRNKAMRVIKIMLEERRGTLTKKQDRDFLDVVLEEMNKAGTILSEQTALDLLFALPFAAFEFASSAVVLALQYLQSNPLALAELTESGQRYRNKGQV
ncbi:hypothetical protein J1N35_027794 [Gossypium stocksii]|uniref:RNase H type-1 domain-containing protein n=1 Tax=Gossypium stocksii TaxID=47602 RepID=A0A9D3ZZY1_9ROSI|nr:hypothetical protein J1N35_027794 [Gossypium stocksii]